ncbi:RrF2 family transcriptional regulator [Brevibacterium aurantiacum]|uniref:RrF2 family transcriptional regulator n=1 Tax=Brevibacterium aurantiacum TaxID=273384 RepID=UPI00005101E1|nr:Rrf2 family transcriptional regulator [Brevibacterium aurantiacum]MDN5876447.1 Rrf2 family transcriptional regulator [Brevibacterium sp.]MDN6666262.1 Rrf2 family transcriptional regulator [Brevibacterium sp.]
MRVTTKSDYALRALIEIANVTDGEPISADELGKRQDIPKGFLQAILADLRRVEIVSSVRGKSGGWRLTKSASATTVADVIRAVDGPLVSIYGQRPEVVEYDDAAESLQQVWIAARFALRDVLEQVTIEQLAAKSLPAEVTEKVAIEDAWHPH